jgi:hypothetical protein
LDEAIGLLRDGGWIDRALDVALRRAHVAQERLQSLPSRPALPVLEGLGRYLVERVEAERRV